MLDGELVVLGPDGTSRFDLLSKRALHRRGAPMRGIGMPTSENILARTDFAVR